MTPSPNPFSGFRFPAEVIQHAVWLYHCFSLSLRDVETILAARGVVVSYESIREWGLRFGRLFANTLKRRRPKPGDKWHLDEVLILSGRWCTIRVMDVERQPEALSGDALRHWHAEAGHPVQHRAADLCLGLLGR